MIGFDHTIVFMSDTSPESSPVIYLDDPAWAGDDPGMQFSQEEKEAAQARYSAAKAAMDDPLNRDNPQVHREYVAARRSVRWFCGDLTTKDDPYIPSYLARPTWKPVLPAPQEPVDGTGLSNQQHSVRVHAVHFLLERLRKNVVSAEEGIALTILSILMTLSERFRWPDNHGEEFSPHFTHINEAISLLNKWRAERLSDMMCHNYIRRPTHRFDYVPRKFSYHTLGYSTGKEIVPYVSKELFMVENIVPFYNFLIAMWNVTTPLAEGTNEPLPDILTPPPIFAGHLQTPATLF